MSMICFTAGRMWANVGLSVWLLNLRLQIDWSHISGYFILLGLQIKRQIVINSPTVTLEINSFAHLQVHVLKGKWLIDLGTSKLVKVLETHKIVHYSIWMNVLVILCKWSVKGFFTVSVKVSRNFVRRNGGIDWQIQMVDSTKEYREGLDRQIQFFNK